jgi:hypothetical protein
MKPIFVVVVLAVLFCNVSFAQEDKQPADFTVLKKTYDAAYEEAVKKATESLTKTYLQNLDKLKKKYGAAGDIKSAALVQEEIDRIGGSGEDTSNLSKMVSGKTFAFSFNGRFIANLTLEQNGTLTGSSSPNETSWKIDEKKKALLFVRNDGVVSTKFTVFKKENGKLLITGNFMLANGIVHTLKEL